MIKETTKRLFRPIDLFNNMTDEDFHAVHEAGQLINLCNAIAIDLQPEIYEKNNTYSA